MQSWNVVFCQDTAGVLNIHANLDTYYGRNYDVILEGEEFEQGKIFQTRLLWHVENSVGNKSKIRIN